MTELVAPPENLLRVFGPPGTGKTTYLSNAIRSTVRERQTSRILVASFTKAAATEIAGRGIPVDRGNIGTLHALAYRSVGRPAVAADEELGEWNKSHPHLALTAGSQGLDESPLERVTATDGDKLMAQIEILRGRMVPEEAWPSMQTRRFYKAWVDWKREREVVDFTDMLEMALEQTESAPGDPLVGVYDEAQDFTPLELRLVHHWARSMDRVVICGDDDQSLYAFRGATPEAFLDPPLPDSQKRVLAQSYRVPRAVHAAAQRWVEGLSRREPKEYAPRDEDGCVRPVDACFDRPMGVVNEIERLLDTKTRDEDSGLMRPRTIMVMASCSYMLDKVKHQLRAEGIPFHNPYRTRRGDWNPLGSTRGTSSSAKLLCYLAADERIFGDDARFWTGDDVRKWASSLRKTGVFRRGASAALAGLPDRELTYSEVAALFDEGVDLGRALDPSVDWYRENLVGSASTPMQYPLRVAERDPLLLAEVPQVIIGTIHSLKGSQADAVILSPDLSMAGMREWTTHGEAQDGVRRQMYVGMTRAREELIVTQPSSPAAIDPAELTRGAP